MMRVPSLMALLTVRSRVAVIELPRYAEAPAALGTTWVLVGVVQLAEVVHVPACVIQRVPTARPWLAETTEASALLTKPSPVTSPCHQFFSLALLLAVMSAVSAASTLPSALTSPGIENCRHFSIVMRVTVAELKVRL